MRITNNCSYFKIQDSLIESAFNTRDIKSISITAEHNCCKTVEEVLDFNLPEYECSYISEYCNFPNQNVCGGSNDDEGANRNPQNCEVNPLGSYYNKLFALYIKINGESVNVLSDVYTLPLDNDLVVNDIQTALNDFPNVEIELDASTDEDDFLCVKLNIKGVPSGVIPENFVLANEDTCYVISDFNCLSEEEFLECSLYSVTLPYSEDVLPQDNLELFEFIYDDYSIVFNIYGDNNSFYYTTEEDFFERLTLIVTEDQLNGVLDISVDEIEEFVNSFSVEVVDGFVIINSTTYPPNSISYGYNGSIYTDSNSCVEQEELSIECIPSVIVDSSFNYVQSVTKQDDDSIAPYPYIFGSTEISDLVDEGFLIEYGDYITITAPDDGVYAINLYSTHTEQTEEFIFTCENIKYFYDDYEPNKIRFIKDGFLIFPEFFGDSELQDGIYSFEITIETEFQKETFRFCKFVDCKTKCYIAKLEKLEDLSSAYKLYETLKFAEECNDDCSCDNMCNLYNQLLNLIKNCNNDSFKREPCGCKKSCGCSKSKMWDS